MTMFFKGMTDSNECGVEDEKQEDFHSDHPLLLNLNAIKPHKLPPMRLVPYYERRLIELLCEDPTEENQRLRRKFLKYYKKAKGYDRDSDGASSVSSLSDYGAQNGQRNLLWKDPSILEDIPELFTIDLDQGFEPLGGKGDGVFLKCTECFQWVESMYKTYKNPRFCIQRIGDIEELQYFKNKGIDWPILMSWFRNSDSKSAGGDDEDSNEWETEDEGSSLTDHIDDSTGIEGCGMRHESLGSSPERLVNHQIDSTVVDETPNYCTGGCSTTGDTTNGENSGSLIICLGRDEELGIPTHHNRVHIRSHGSQPLASIKELDDTFRIRSSSSDDPSAANFTHHIGGIIAEPSSEESWERARQWLSDCRHHHEPCRLRDTQSRNPASWPARLLDLQGNSRNQDIIKLVDSKALSPESICSGYLALSYCWGCGDQPHATVGTNVVQRYEKGFSIREQPTTIQDAILTTRQLGFRYLWIDSLCIIQHDANDLARELIRMALIYENATLLISAARAATQNDGFLSAIDPEKIEHSELQFSLPFRYRHKGVQGYVVLDSLFGWDISGGKWRGKEPIHTRGWTMQEHLLSKRILAFGTTGVRWQCLYDMEYGSARWSKYTDVSEILSVSSNMNCRSCVSSRPNYEVKAPALPSVERIWRYHRDSLEPQYEWNQLRASYIARALSKAEDRLVAFSAIPRQFVSTLGSEQNYIAGHWQSQLPKDLLWDGTNLRSYRRGTFPSWSWVSRCGASGQSVGDSIFFQDTDGRETAQVWSADTELMDPNNPFGGVVSSKLLMCAKLLPVIVQFKSDKDNDEFEIQDVDLALSNKVPNVFAAQKYEFSGKLDGFYRGLSEAELMGETQPHGMPDHYLLEILQDTRTWPCWSHSQGLIVQSGRQDKGSLQEYTRIGTFELGCCAGASCHCHVHRKIKLEMRVKKARAPRRHNSPFDYHQEKTFYLC